MTTAIDMSLDDFMSDQKKDRTLSRTVRGGIRSRGSRGRNNANSASHSNLQPFVSKPRRTTESTPSGGKNQLIVSNLHNRVTEKDLYELFSSIGPLRRAFLHLGPNGTSAGVATIVFKEAQDARRAMAQYNDVELDKRPMRISYPREPAQSATRNSNTNRNRGRRPRPQQRTPRKKQQPSAHSKEDLDADLDKYMQTNDAAAPPTEDTMME